MPVGLARVAAARDDYARAGDMPSATRRGRPRNGIGVGDLAHASDAAGAEVMRARRNARARGLEIGGASARGVGPMLRNAVATSRKR
jgi:hypothetical protein